VNSNRYIKCPDKIYQPRLESDDKGRDEMGNKDAHTFLTKRGSHQVTHLVLTL
jgi:hypothetical protein